MDKEKEQQTNNTVGKIRSDYRPLNFLSGLVITLFMILSAFISVLLLTIIVEDITSGTKNDSDYASEGMLSYISSLPWIAVIILLITLVAAFICSEIILRRTQQSKMQLHSGPRFTSWGYIILIASIVVSAVMIIYTDVGKDIKEFELLNDLKSLDSKAST